MGFLFVARIFFTRPKTASNFYDAKCHPSAIRERSVVMHDLASDKKRRFFEEHIGSTVNVLFETVDNDGYRKGFSGNYLRVGTQPGHISENELAPVQIREISGDFCVGARPAVP